MMIITVPGVRKREMNHDTLMFMVGIGVHSRDTEKGLEVKFDTNKLDYEFTAEPYELKIWVKGSRRFLQAKANNSYHSVPWFSVEMFN